MKIQIIKINRIFLLVFALFVFCENGLAQDPPLGPRTKMKITQIDLAILKNATVRIESKDDEGEIIDNGAGIIVGYQNDKLYIATAHHVVKEADEQNIFFRESIKEYPASVLQPHHNLDLAILVANVPSSDALVIPTLNTRRLDEKKDMLGADVLVIGHPGFASGHGWLMINGNSIQEFNHPAYDKDSDLFTITGTNINGGCSGGPVFDEDRNLIGMVKTISGFQSECIKIKEIEEMLTGLNLPKNKLQPAFVIPPSDGGGRGGRINENITKPDQVDTNPSKKPITPKQKYKESDIYGTWVNEKSAKSSELNKIVISKSRRSKKIQPYVKCSLGSCDWGVKTLGQSRLSKNTANYQRGQNNITIMVSQVGKNRIHVKTISKYTARNGRQSKPKTKNYYFKKSARKIKRVRKY